MPPDFIIQHWSYTKNRVLFSIIHYFQSKFGKKINDEYFAYSRGDDEMGDLGR